MNEENLKEAVLDYINNAFDDVVEPKNFPDVIEETLANHVKRNEQLLKEPPSHDQSDHRACLQARLLNIVREKRMNKYQNRSDEMRDNIRQLFEINSELQSMITHAKHDNQKPNNLFCNSKEFHDESYQMFLEDLNRRLKSDYSEMRSRS
ncbi:unnamed protein product [Bursaphelenchus xylophilus]|uniref:(pine wood nematode) hypothetical protein n=1 Tax=Bursaphelenchus xylophilus TaxID=6326 RepID=A0A1I7RS11_BURXY|nr:unnamed protein product [Bursaphelenchus xylophilus]CAG9123333.1 unnamed protein product [Bursaphelenchus xylophilus]